MLKQPESTRGIILKRSFNIFLFTVVATPLGYLMRILFSRTLSIEMFGLFYAVLAFSELFAPFQDLGTGFALSYFTPKLLKTNDKKSVWLLFVYSMIVRFFISMIIAWLIIWKANYLAVTYFKTEAAESLLSAFAVYLLLNGLITGFNQLFVGLQKEKYYAAAEPLRLIVIVLFTGIATFLNRGDIVLYTFIWNLAYFVILVYCCWLFISKHSYFISTVIWQKQIVTKLFSFSTPLFINNIIFLFTNQIGLVFLVYFHNVVDVGAYNVILPIVTIPLLFISPLQSVLFPMVSEFMHSDSNKVKLLIENFLKIVPLIIIYFNFFVFLFPEYTLGLLFSNKWISSSTMPLRVAAISFTFSTIVTCLTIFADGMGLVKERVKLLLILAGLNFILSGVLIWYFNVIGLIISNAIIAVFSLLIFGNLIYTKIRFSIPVSLYFKYFLLLTGMYLLVRVFRISPDTWYEYGALGVVYTALSFAFSLHQGLLDNKIIPMTMARLNIGLPKKLIKQ